jgi:hypothetical protein
MVRAMCYTVFNAIMSESRRWILSRTLCQAGPTEYKQPAAGEHLGQDPQLGRGSLT